MQFFFHIIFIIIFFVIPAYADDIDNLEKGYWTALPNTRADSVAPTGIASNCDETPCVMLPWSGGAYDTTNSRLLIHGGGHSDYSGNEIYAFSLLNLTWSRIWGPSNWPTSGGECAAKGSCTELYADGTPASVHTYGGLVYDQTNDLFMRVGGSLCCSGGNSASGVYTISVTTPTSWTKKADLPNVIMPYNYCARHNSTGKIYCVNYQQLYEFTFPNTWTPRGSAMPGINEDSMAAAIDQDNGILVISGEGKLYTWNLSTFIFTDRSNSSSGNKTVQNSRFAGLTWDSLNHKLVGFAAGGSAIYILNTSSWVWTQVSSSGGPTPPVTHYPYPDQGGGVYGRFQYSASRDVFVYAVNMNNNVYVLKNPLSSGNDNQAPLVPQSLRIVN